MKLNKVLLDIIIAVQAKKKFEVSEKYLKQDLGTEKDYDWFRATEAYYYSLDKELFKLAGIKKNNINFVKILDFKLDERVFEVEEYLLGEFEVPM